MINTTQELITRFVLKVYLRAKDRPEGGFVTAEVLAYGAAGVILIFALATMFTDVGQEIITHIKNLILNGNN